MIKTLAVAVLLWLPLACQQPSKPQPEGTSQMQTEDLKPAQGQDEPIPVDAVKVTTLAELTAAIGHAEAGTTIVMADGTYNGASSIVVGGKQGSEESPITIRAEHRGKALITGKAYFNVSKSSYIVIQGIRFQEKGNVGAIKLVDSHHIRVTRNYFTLTESVNTKWVELQGSKSHHNRIDHNEFGPRHELGQMIAFQGSGQVSQYDVIENNYFHDIASQKSNGGETIRLGLSGLSMSDGFITVQNNLFVNCDGDPEVISDKTGHNTIRYNTFINNKAQVTARHGHGSSFYGNFFIGDGKKPGVGGLRIYANDQIIYNNYFYRLTADAINIDGGDFDAGPEGKNYTEDNLAAHWRVYRAQVVHNTVVDSTTGIIIGQSYRYPPVDVTVADNIIVNSRGILYDEQMKTNAVFAGNIGYGGKLSNADRTNQEMKNVDPLLSVTDGLMKLSDGSPAIDAAVGDYPFVKEDLDGQARSQNDVGADEFATGAVVHKPLTPSDVGPDAE